MNHVQYNHDELRSLNFELKSLLDQVQQDFASQSRVIKGVWINHTRLDSESVDELGAVPVSQFFAVRIESESSDQIVLDTMVSLCGAVQSIKSQIKGIELDLMEQDHAMMAHHFDFMLTGLQDFTEALTLVRQKLLDEGYLKEPKLWFRVENSYRDSVKAVYEHFFKSEWALVSLALKEKLLISLDLWLGQFEDIKNCLEFENTLSKI